MPEPAAATRAEARPRGRRLVAASWIGLLLLVPSVLYVSHVFSQLQEETRQNLRLLGTSAGRLDGVLDNARKTARNLTKNFHFACEFLERQPRLSLVDRKCESLADWPSVEVPAARVVAQDLQLRIVVDAGGPARTAVLGVDLEKVLADIPLDAAFDFVLIVDETGKVVVQHGRGDLRIENVGVLADLGSDAPVDVRALGQGSGIFDVTFAEQRYQLLAQPLRVRGLGAAEAAETTGGAAPPSDAPAAAPAKQTDDAPAAGAKKADDAPAAGAKTGESAADAGSRWTICGLVNRGGSVQRAFAVSPILVMVLVLVLLFGVLTWPLIKLALLTQRERVRFVDVFLLAVSVFGTLSLVAILLIDADSYRRLRHLAEGRLEGLASGVEGQLLAELEELHDQLQDYDRQLASQSAILDRCELGEAVDLLAPGSPRAPGAGPPPVCSLVLEAPRINRDFTSVFWMRAEDGLQIAKATVFAENTPAVTLSTRKYFTTVIEGRLWRVPRRQPEAGSGPMRFFVESFRSITTGELHSALSICSRLDDPERDGCDVAAAISTPMIAMADPVLEPGYGFAVIEEDGRVLYHSDHRRTLEDDVYADVGAAKRLRSAVYSRTAQHLETSYLGRPHQLFVRPIDGLPWLVVTFLDAEILRSTNIESLAQAILYLALYLVLIFVVPSLIYLLWQVSRARGVDIRWLWPDRSKLRVYRHLTWIFAVFAVCFVAALQALPLRIGLAVSFLLPAAALMVAAGRMTLWSWRDERRCSDRVVIDAFSVPIMIAAVAGIAAMTIWHRPEGSVNPSFWAASLAVLIAVHVLLVWTSPERPAARRLRERIDRYGFWPWHYAASFLLWVLIAVLPALGFLRATFETQQTVLLKDKGLALSRALDERGCAIRDELAKIRAPEDGCDLDRRLEVPRRGVYLAAISPRPAGLDYEGFAPAMRFVPGRLAPYKPLYNATSIRSRYLNDAGAADGSWRWSEYGGEVVLVHGPMRCTGSEVLGGELAIPVSSPGPITVLGGLLALLVLAFGIRHSARKFFFGEVEDQVERLEPRSLIRAEIQGNVIALLASPLDRKVVLASSRYEAVELEDEDAGATLTPKGELKPVVCDHFERGLHDPARRLVKLARLEGLIFSEQRQVVILASVDPFALLFGLDRDTPEDTPIRLGDDEPRRWARVLSEFVLLPVFLAKSPDPESGDEKTFAPLEQEAQVPWLTPELNATLHLRRLVRSRLYGVSFAGVELDEGLERVVEAAEGYYWALWTACSEDEKLVLVQLAQEGFVNPRQARVVRRLLQRGLVVRDPALRLMNQSFALFVKRIQQPREVAQWEKAVGGLGWQHLRWVFLGLLAMIVLFLSVTQPMLVETGLGFASALAVGVPGLIQLVNALYRGRFRSHDG